MGLRWIVTTLFLTGLSGPSAAAKGLALVVEGEARAVIVVPEAAAPDELRAAQELQRYAERMSGARLDLQPEAALPRQAFVSLGATEAARKLGLKPNEQRVTDSGFVMKTSGRGLYLLGATPRATLFAVYTLLEDLGCRFYAPGAAGEVIPRRQNLTVPPTNRVEKPSFVVRNFWGGLLSDMTIDYRRAVREWMMKVKFGGPASRYSDTYGFHIFLPADRYWDAHPEWYSLRDGRRWRYDGFLCVSNVAMRREFARNVIAWLRKNPDLVSAPISPHDDPPRCECENCRALDDPRYPGNFTRRMLVFANDVAEQVTQAMPDKFVHYVGVEPEMMQLPADVKPHPHVLISFLHSLNAACGLDHPARAGLRQVLQQWSAHTPVCPVHHQLHPRLWAYLWTTFCAVEWTQFRGLKDLEFYHDNGVFAVNAEVLGWSPSAILHLYLMSKKLWNVNTDTERLREEFYRLYYGQAGRFVRAMQELMQQAWTEKGADHSIGDFLILQVYTPELLARLRQTLARAQQAAQGEPEVLRRLEAVEVSLRITDDFVRATQAVFRYAATRSETDRLAAAETVERAVAYAESVQYLNVVPVAHLLSQSYAYYRDFRGIVSNPAPNTRFPEVGPFSYYYDLMHDGPLTAHDAIALQGGVQVTWSNLSLEPKSEGELLFEWLAPEGAAFDTVSLRPALHGAHNLRASSIAVSVDGGQTWADAAQDVEPYREIDVTPLVQGRAAFLLRFTGRNDTAQQVTFVENIQLVGTTAPAAADLPRPLLGRWDEWGPKSFVLPPEQRPPKHFPPAPQRLVLFEDAMDAAMWSAYHHAVSVATEADNALLKSVAEPGGGNTYLRLLLRPETDYVLEFQAKAVRGEMTAMAEGPQGWSAWNAQAKVAEGPPMQSYRLAFQTPAWSEERVPITLNFVTQVDEGEFYLDDVVLRQE
jgi:hypothetical protein